MRSGPRTEVYLRSDIANILEALRLVASTVNGDVRHRAGYMQALAAVGTAVGLEPKPERWAVVPPQRPRQPSGNGDRVVLLMDGKVQP
jgi:hypothetical protein